MMHEFKAVAAVVVGALVIVGVTETISSAGQVAPQPLTCTSSDAVSLAPLSAMAVAQ